MRSLSKQFSWCSCRRYRALFAWFHRYILCCCCLQGCGGKNLAVVWLRHHVRCWFLQPQEAITTAPLWAPYKQQQGDISSRRKIKQASEIKTKFSFLSLSCSLNPRFTPHDDDENYDRDQESRFDLVTKRPLISSDFVNCRHQRSIQARLHRRHNHHPRAIPESEILSATQLRGGGSGGKNDDPKRNVFNMDQNDDKTSRSTLDYKTTNTTGNVSVVVANEYDEEQNNQHQKDKHDEETKEPEDRRAVATVVSNIQQQEPASPDSGNISQQNLENESWPADRNEVPSTFLQKLQNKQQSTSNCPRYLNLAVAPLATTTSSSSTAATIPTSSFGASSFPPKLRVTVHQTQGMRSYMEDEHVIGQDCVAIMDGHGGKAVSRYLRQNLLAEIQRAKMMMSQMQPPPSTGKERNETSRLADSSPIGGETDRSQDSNNHTTDEKLDQRTMLVSNDDDHHYDHHFEKPNTSATGQVELEQVKEKSNVRRKPHHSSFEPHHRQRLTVDDYVGALQMALDKVDRDVQKISHWSYQGSTAVVVWLVWNSPSQPPPPHHTDGEDGGLRSSEEIHHGSNDVCDETSRVDVNLVEGAVAYNVSGHPEGTTTSTRTASASSASLTLVVANIGDSRAILYHGGVITVLTKDHKPDDPDEYHRITSLGGQITLGSSPSSVPRVNGNLALSRAVGDRSERPYVTAQPDMMTVSLNIVDRNENNRNKKERDFVVLATDGLWDVMSNAEVVDFVQSQIGMCEKQLEGDNDKHRAASCATDPEEEITQRLVQEALDRGSGDNITVVIIWL
ncbi:hypothetical protein ACA910_017680 [Epithemia clementina (nom. ined.)]